MPRRRKRSKTDRIRLFQEKGGICDICRGKICAGEAWHLDHRIPLELSGDDSDANLFPVHDKCHRDKTRGDVRQIAKTKRQQQKHMGIRNKSTFRKRTRVNDDGTPEEWTGFRWREMR